MLNRPLLLLGFVAAAVRGGGASGPWTAHGGAAQPTTSMLQLRRSTRNMRPAAVVSTGPATMAAVAVTAGAATKGAAGAAVAAAARVANRAKPCFFEAK